MRQTPNEKNRPVLTARAADLKNRGEKTALAPANERAALAWLGLAWLGLAWLGLAWQHDTGLPACGVVCTYYFIVTDI
jgi:hypothetical protein